MKQTTYETTRFGLYDDGFYVEVSNPYGVYNFYLCHKNHCHKSYMFCLPSTVTDKREWERMINDSIEIYIGMYWDEVNAFEKAEGEIAEDKFWENIDKYIGYIVNKSTNVTEIE